MKTLSFPHDPVPVLAEAQLVVVGGGVAGLAAAVSAARNGARALLVEQAGCCGGMTTRGLLPSIICMGDGERLLSGGLCKEVVDALARHMEETTPSYSWQDLRPEVLKRLYDEMLEAAGVQVLFETTVIGVRREGSRIAALECWTPAGRAAIAGTLFVDATGDGALAAEAGVPFQYGDANHEVMAPTLCTAFDNIDYSLNSRRNGLGRAEWAKAQEEKRAPLPEGHFVGFFRNGPSEGLGNLGHMYGTDVLDVLSRSKAWATGRRLAQAYLDFFRADVAGFANAQLAATADMMGVRESRRIQGDYTLTQEDYFQRRHFSDDVGSFAYPIDIHASGNDTARQAQTEKTLEATTYKNGENYGVPYRAILAQGVENLLVAGRCVSADRAMQASLRVVPGCMITGEAAGTAAALALKDRTSLREVSIPALQARLRRQGLYIP